MPSSPLFLPVFYFHKVIWFSIHVYLVNSAVRANFEFIKKLGVEKWCFHDRDIAPEGSTLEVRILLILHFLIFPYNQNEPSVF